VTRQQIADRLAKRARDGVDRCAGFLARRAAEAAAEAERSASSARRSDACRRRFGRPCC